MEKGPVPVANLPVPSPPPPHSLVERTGADLPPLAVVTIIAAVVGVVVKIISD